MTEPKMGSSPGIDLSELAARGYTRVPRLVDQNTLLEFESVVAQLARTLATDRRIPPSGREPLIDVMQRGGQQRVRLFGLLRNLFVVQRMSVRIGERLAADGFLQWAGMQTPAIWPSLRVDIPGEETYLLPMHQDYSSTQSHRAWRLWIALRDLDSHYGTMRVVPGTHTKGFLAHDVSDPKYPKVLPDVYEGAPAEEITLAAGDGILFSPMLLHESVPNSSDRIKFVLLVQIQDVSAMADPDDPDDGLSNFARIAMGRDGPLDRRDA